MLPISLTTAVRRISCLAGTISLASSVLQLADAAALEHGVVGTDAREQRLLRRQRDHVVARQLEQPAGLVDLAIDRDVDLVIGS